MRSWLISTHSLVPKGWPIMAAISCGVIRPLLETCRLWTALPAIHGVSQVLVQCTMRCRYGIAETGDAAGRAWPCTARDRARISAVPANRACSAGRWLKVSYCHGNRKHLASQLHKRLDRKSVGSGKKEE